MGGPDAVAARVRAGAGAGDHLVLMILADGLNQPDSDRQPAQVVVSNKGKRRTGRLTLPLPTADHVVFYQLCSLLA